MSEPKQLPMGWEITKVKDLTELVQSGFPNGQFNIDGKGIPHLRPMNIDSQGRVNLDEVKYVEVNNPPLLQSGDVLFNNTNSPVWVGKTAYVDRSNSYTFSNHMTCVRFYQNELEPKFFAIQLHHLQQQGFFKQHCTNHVNQASINAGFLSENVELLVPPLAEQQRIVAAIEQQFTRLDAGIASLRQAQARLKRYRAAVLKAAVEGRLTAAWRAAHPDAEPAATLLARILAERRARWEDEQRAKGKDPAKLRYDEPTGPDTTYLPALPEGWEWANMDQIISYMRNGLPQKPTSTPPGNRILRINAVRPLNVNMSEVRYLDLPNHETESYFIQNGDLLFTRYNGSIDLLGVAGLVRNCIEPTLHPDKLIRIKTFLHPLLSPFLEIAANVGSSREFLKSKARTTAGQTGISGIDIRQMPIPLPSLAEQEEIVAEVERRLSVVSEVEAEVAANLKRAERLRQSILREAFAGRLVAQDPADEPASALLARIQSERAGRDGNGGRRRRADVAQQAQKMVQRPDVEAERVPTDARQLTLLAE